MHPCTRYKENNENVLQLAVFLFLCKQLGSHLLSWASYVGNATVLHSASQRSFLRVNLHGSSLKGPRSAATVYSPKTLSMRFCFFIV